MNTYALYMEKPMSPELEKLFDGGSFVINPQFRPFKSTLRFEELGNTIMQLCAGAAPAFFAPLGNPPGYMLCGFKDATAFIEGHSS